MKPVRWIVHLNSNMRKVKGFYTKSTKVAGKEVVLYSTNGLTWSSNKAELKEISIRNKIEMEKIGRSFSDQEATSLE